MFTFTLFSFLPQVLIFFKERFHPSFNSDNKVKLFFSPSHPESLQGKENLCFLQESISGITWKVCFYENRMTKHKAIVSLIGLKFMIPEFFMCLCWQLHGKIKQWMNNAHFPIFSVQLWIQTLSPNSCFPSCPKYSFQRT